MGGGNGRIGGREKGMVRNGGEGTNRKNKNMRKNMNMYQIRIITEKVERSDTRERCENKRVEMGILERDFQILTAQTENETLCRETRANKSQNAIKGMRKREKREAGSG